MNTKFISQLVFDICKDKKASWDRLKRKNMLKRQTNIKGETYKILSRRVWHSAPETLLWTVKIDNQYVYSLSGPVFDNTLINLYVSHGLRQRNISI